MRQKSLEKRKHFECKNATHCSRESYYPKYPIIELADLMDSLIQLNLFGVVHCLRFSYYSHKSRIDHFEPYSSHYVRRRTVYTRSIELRAYEGTCPNRINLLKFNARSSSVTLRLAMPLQSAHHVLAVLRILQCSNTDSLCTFLVFNRNFSDQIWSLQWKLDS